MTRAVNKHVVGDLERIIDVTCKIGEENNIKKDLFLLGKCNMKEKINKVDICKCCVDKVYRNDVEKI